MKTLSRRTLLRGAGAAVALPFLESMGSARGAAQPPLRMAIATVTGGTVIESWRMPQGGALGKLPSILRPLEPLKNDLLVITGLAHHGKADGLNAHEHAGYLHLTGAPEVGKVHGKPRSAVSVDQLVAQTIGDRTYLPSIEIGFSNHETRYSWRAADQPVPFESNPRLIFDRMFRGRSPVAPNWARRGDGAAAAPAPGRTDSDEQSVVDVVLEEARALRGTLGGADKHKLEEYLHSIQSVERRIRTLSRIRRQEELDAKSPGPSKPSAPGRIPEGPAIGKMQQAAGRDPEVHAEYTTLLGDLMILALQTDTTRVATFAIGSDEAQFPGVITVGYERHAHTLEHQGNAHRVEDADPIAREACRQIHAFYTELVAGMAAKMKAIDEGGSSLLDNTMLLYTSYMADGGHGREDYPVCLIGKAQGTLKTGRQLDFPKKTPVSNLYLEMLGRMGLKADAFGESATSKHAAFNGRLPGLA
jgi:hypothetical protein